MVGRFAAVLAAKPALNLIAVPRPVKRTWGAVRPRFLFVSLYLVVVYVARAVGLPTKVARKTMLFGSRTPHGDRSMHYFAVAVAAPAVPVRVGERDCNDWRSRLTLIEFRRMISMRVDDCRLARSSSFPANSITSSAKATGALMINELDKGSILTVRTGPAAEALICWSTDRKSTRLNSSHT